VVLGAGPALAQAAGTQQQQPPATPPAAQEPAPAPAAPVPFPEGAKVAYVDVQFIATNSESGKAARDRLDQLNKKLMGELRRSSRRSRRTARSSSRAAAC
jgi:hypothetical protein